MGTFIGLVLVAAVVAIVGFGVALTVSSKREFRQANEIVPGLKSSAPASWAGAHSPEAKLHRRLGDAVRAAHANPKFKELGLSAKTDQVGLEAQAIDDRLIAAAALPQSHRAEAVEALAPAVQDLEDAVAALIRSTTVAESKELLQQSVSEADIKLQALAKARAEVERIDRAASGTIDTPLATDPGDTPEPGPSTATG